MCKKCDHLDQKIKYYRRRLSTIADHEVAMVLEGIVEKLEKDKLLLHPKEGEHGQFAFPVG